MDPKEPPQNIAQDMARLKAYFPYRIVFCVWDGVAWEVYAKTTKHVINSSLRKGHKVWSI